MMGGMKTARPKLPIRRILVGGAPLLAFAFPAIALADDSSAPVDARLEGFKQGIMASPGSTALTWLLLVGIGVVTIGVMFMSAKRSHLD
jgi:hypothetical protein